MTTDRDTAVDGPYLDLDLDPEVWLIGPTPQRPLDAWLDPAVEVQSAVFGLPEGPSREREVVTAVLGGTARQHPSPLPLFAVRWPQLATIPVVLFFGLVERDPDTGRDWLSHVDAQPVESPLVEDVDAPEGTTIRRSLAYSAEEAGGIVASVRYLVDTGHAGAWVLAHAASDDPGDLVAARDDVDALLRTVRVSTEPPA